MGERRFAVKPVPFCTSFLAHFPSVTTTNDTTPPPTSPDEPPADGGPREVGGPEGPEPTRYGDWERKGRCIDF